MSDEKELAAPDAVENERLEDQQETETKATNEAEAPEDDADKPEGEADDSEGDDEGQDDKPRKKSRSERLRAQVERLKIENESLRSGSAASAVQDQAGIDALVAKEVGDPPKESDYPNDWFAYERAMTAYEADKRQVARQVKQRVEQSHQAEQARIQELVEDFVDHCEAVAKTLPDFKKVVSNPEYRTTDLVKRLILDAGDKAPLVSYHLAQNPKLCARVNAMSPVEAAREIGRIEGRVSLPKNTATRAPSPVNPVKGGASPSRALGKSMSDYEKWRNQ